MADYFDEEEHVELEDHQKVALAKWFLLNAPSGEMQQVAKDVREVLANDRIFDLAASEAYPEYNLKEMISLEMPDGSGQVLVSRYGEIDSNQYLDPRTAQVTTVDHVKQVAKSVRPASDDELPSAYVDQYRAAVDAELVKYVEEAYPKGSSAVYCTRGKDAQSDAEDFELTVVISTANFSPKNFRGGRWRSLWKIEINGNDGIVEMRGQLQVNAHYFEEGNVQLTTSYECPDSTILQDVIGTGVSIVTAIRHQESEYLSALEEKYANLSDTTFKELRRKLPITRTQFAWDKALQLSLSRQAAKQISVRSPERIYT